MNVIPIVFAFDEKLIFPVKISISSLLMNAGAETFYDIFILHSEYCIIDDSDFNRLVIEYKNCRIQFRSVGNQFEGGFEIRNITTACYYRLLIPQAILEYDKIIYADVDIIFRMDLFKLYSVDISDYYIAATLDLGMVLTEDGMEYIKANQMLDIEQYIQSGFLVFNLKKMREDNLLLSFKKMYKKKLRYQDQDILNIVCRNSKKILPMKYNMTVMSYYVLCSSIRRGEFLKSEEKEAMDIGNIHYNGYKPWNHCCANFDIWWEYYRHSIYFDHVFYYDFFNRKAFEQDTMPLLDRLKILYRYFRYRQYKHHDGRK